MTDAPELFLFTQGGKTYAYTSELSDITFNGVEYVAVPISRGEIEVNNDINRADMAVTVARDNELAMQYFLQLNEFNTTLTVYQMTSATTADAFWKGRITGFKPQGDEVEFACESVFTSLRRTGLRAKYQRGCRHPLYGPGCSVNKDAFAIPGTVTNLAGQVVSVDAAASKPNGYFQGGMIRLPDGAYRFIQAHAGSQLTLMRAVPSLAASIAAGQSGVVLYPGCNRSRETCINTFGNGDNFGGYPWIPIRNPFDGEAIA